MRAADCPPVVATRKCRINCNETLSPPYRLSNGRQSGAAAEVVDARHRVFSFLRGGAWSRAASGVFLEGQGLGQEQLLSAIDEQPAIELVREFDSVSGVAALAGARGQGDGVGSEGDDVIGADDALVAKTEAAGEIETPGESAEIAGGIGGGAGEALVVVVAKSGQDGIGLL